ncbi:MAG: ABC transporter ATP-binding protein [Gemmatimonadetes bacterium]|nr:ABC transporter ATP-binding protein [Gemmatimonadota bacterium]
MNAAPALEVADACKHFALGDQTVEVLRGVSLRAEVGQSLALIGPSGSGKSTLLHLLGTLEPPTTGQIAISGQDPLALPEPQLARFRNQHIGFVFQNHHLLPQYSALENALIPTLAFPSAELRRSASSVRLSSPSKPAEPSKPQADRRERAHDLLTAVGLAERLHHRPAELSGGECQRVAVARALINQPDLLLCDEPTGSLDRQMATTVADLLFTLHRAEQAALVIATHDLELAARCDRRLLLREGTCVEA